MGLLALLVFAPGCRSIKEAYAATLLTGTTLTWRQYLEVGDPPEPNPTVDQVIGKLGEPAKVHVHEGMRRKLNYNGFSMTDELRWVEFIFDEDERLVKKEMW